MAFDSQVHFLYDYIVFLMLETYGCLPVLLLMELSESLFEYEGRKES